MRLLAAELGGSDPEIQDAWSDTGSAPDLVWEQYGPVTSGALPAGLLQNIKPYLDKPNPYVNQELLEHYGTRGSIT